MKLSQLFSLYPHLHWGESASADITDLVMDSRKVEKGSVFVALRGTRFDSHECLEEVCNKGAIGVVVEDRAGIPESYQGAVLEVKNSRIALHQLSSRFYGDPSESMFCVGITGTNGKSTITLMVEAILQEFGWPTGVMGTIDHHIGETRWKTNLTTPEAITFHKRLNEFKSLSAKACCMEVSSIALEQNRIGSVSFDVAVFTNLTRDHLDYHADMKSYLEAKQKLFTDLLAYSKKSTKFAIVNIDDPYGRELMVHEGARYWSYGKSSEADLSFQIVKQDFQNTQVKVSTPRGEGYFNLKIPGVHNVYNALAAIGVGLAAGVSLDKCLTALDGLAGVPGRLEVVANDKGVHTFVDYAHTDDALANVINVLREIRDVSNENGRIITLFGCGGDRDRGKRSLMGKVAWELSDLVFVTSDNPRSESPEKIIEDIIEELPEESRHQRLFVEVDRYQAIERALRMANKGDVVLIAGKGHEDYQVIGDEVRDFSDVEVAKEVFNKLVSQ